MADKIYMHSIMTTVFTTKGDMVVIINDNDELDTIPQYFMGHREDKKYTGAEGFDILNSENDYKEAVGYFLAFKSKATDVGIKNGLLVGNKESLVDCGELHPRIAYAQIYEMKHMKSPSFIRIKSDILEITVENQKVLNQIQTRYIVDPTLDIDDYQGIKVISPMELEELQREGKIKLSPKLLWQMSGEKIKELKSFSNNLNHVITMNSNRKKVKRKKEESK